MDSARNSTINIINYLKSLGIDVNDGKNKARGNKGFFKHSSFSGFRIDISNQISEEEKLGVLIHEFAHYMHFQYDKTLKSLDFIFSDLTQEITEELIKITVECVPKSFAKEIYGQKDEVKEEIKILSNKLQLNYSDFKISSPYKKIENKLNNFQKFFLKYDKIKYDNKLFSLENLELAETELLYLQLKSKQRLMKRINSRINKLNNYYKSNTEMFARLIEMYFTNPEKTKKIAPICYSKINQIIKNNENSYLVKISSLV